MFNPDLKYQDLNYFDRDMVHTAAHYRIFDQFSPDIKWIHEDDRVIAFERAGLVFAFNFSADKSYSGYTVPVSRAEDYEVLFTSDDCIYGGFGRIERGAHSAFVPGMEGNFVKLYMPPRTCIVLCPKSLYKE